MSIAQILNVPFDVQLGERVLKVKALSITKMLDVFNDIYAADFHKNAVAMSRSIEDPIEKNKFLLDAWKNIPRLKDLSEVVSDIFTPNNLFNIIKLAILENNDITKDELNVLFDECVTNDNVEEYVNIALKILGIDASALKDALKGAPKKQRKKINTDSKKK